MSQARFWSFYLGGLVAWNESVKKSRQKVLEFLFRGLVAWNGFVSLYFRSFIKIQLFQRICGIKTYHVTMRIEGRDIEIALRSDVADDLNLACGSDCCIASTFALLEELQLIP